MHKYRIALFVAGGLLLAFGAFRLLTRLDPADLVVLAVWLVVLRRPRWTWSLLLLPIVASVVVFPLSNGLYGTQLAYSVKAALATAVDAVPFLVAVAGAVIAARFSTDAPAPVEAHGEALVDKSA